jgi:hypothetical protein
MARILATSDDLFHFIYIDPPYNTGQRFAFNDKLPAKGSASWLSFMYPRLRLARELLRTDGILCVSIDDHEFAHLSVLLREIFGAENHLMTIKWRRKRKPSFLGKHSSAVFEYILVVSKDSAKLPKLRGPQTSETSRPVLNHGNSMVKRIIKAGTPAATGDGRREPGVHKVRSLAFELHDPLVVANGKVAKNCFVTGPFRVSQEILDRTLFVTRSWGLRRQVEPSEQKSRHMSDDGSKWATNEDADKEILECFGEKIFPYAKPTLMLRELISMYPVVPPPNDSVTPSPPLRFLDFFAGTGSLGIAVDAQCRSDGIPRVFTLIQSDELLQSNGTSKASKTGCETIFELAAMRLGQHADIPLEVLDWRSKP